MAQRVVVTLSDDIDGGEAAETVAFGLDGKSYEIDLNPPRTRRNCARPSRPYVEAGRKPDACSGKAYKHTALAPDPGRRARLGAVQRLGGAGPRPHPQEGLRGVQRGELTPSRRTGSRRRRGRGTPDRLRQPPPLIR